MREEREVHGERESVQGERVCTGRRGFESETRGSQTRGSRCINATNAGFETRVQVRTREERGRGCGFRVALTQEEHRRGHELRVVLTREGHRRGYGLRVASIQEREGRVKELLERGGEPRLAIERERETGQEREGDSVHGEGGNRRRKGRKGDAGLGRNQGRKGKERKRKGKGKGKKERRKRKKEGKERREGKGW